MRTYRAPATCPVCSDRLITLRVGCPSCATELSGHFGQCRFCSLDNAELAILEVFLRSRGNLRDLQAHLGVSYPTARQRLSDLLNRLGYAEFPAEAATGAGPAGSAPAGAAPAGSAPAGAAPAGSAPAGAAPPSGPVAGPGRASPVANPAPTQASPSPVEILSELAAGRIDVATAERLLGRAPVERSA